MYALPQSVFCMESDIVGGALDNLQNSIIALAYGLRTLLNSYMGPLVKLRRGADNAVQDFFSDPVTGILDVAVINAWRGASTIFVDTWYNQTAGPNAVNTLLAEQPALQLSGKIGVVFKPNVRLTVPASITSLTTSGVAGTVLIVAAASNNACNSFGAYDSSGNRWSSHLNWSDGNCYFDTGACCQAMRAFTNTGQATLAQYSFVRGINTQESRKRGVSRASGVANGTIGSSMGFGIGHAAGTTGTPWHNGNISEFLMLNTALAGVDLANLEADQITFWGV